MKASDVLHLSAMTAKSLAKIMLQSRRCRLKRRCRADALVILANGPSLRTTIDTRIDTLRKYSTLAVNFAANAPEFQLLKPDYYVLADPHFFVRTDMDNVQRLWTNIAAAQWGITLFVPTRYRAAALRLGGENIKVYTFNAVGVEGFKCIERWAFHHNLGMPRPRNVLIPAIMIALAIGFREIYLTGADHSWLKTISVNDSNEVVSIQPHFYKEESKEQARVISEYKGYHLHDILDSFRIAFRSYHSIRAYADAIGAKIFNATQGSFIDAFERKSFPDK
ncbi:MAG: 6-hydroxymethylpterin diphosphokinase MptE-like protein [Muribaculaceae bacterium]